MPLAAQDVGPPRPGEGQACSAERKTPRDRRGQPSLYYLKDKQGNLQAVPNFTLEDFEELYKLKHQLVQGDQRPRYSLQADAGHGHASTRPDRRS